jgi:N-acetyl-alpha-D-muramate 1-phosphate uridylyltransferase
MQIVILCGGLATRLRSITKTIPKSLVPINKRPFLSYQLELLKKNGFANIILCTGHLGEMIEGYTKNIDEINVKCVQEEESLGTGGALRNAIDFLDEEFLVMYGDSYLPFDYKSTIDHFRKNNTDGLMVVYKNENRLEPSNVLIKGGFVVEYNKINPSKEFNHIDYGVSIFKKSLLKKFANKVFDLSEIHQRLIEKNQLLTHETEQRFYQIGSPEGLEEFKKYINRTNL